MSKSPPTPDEVKQAAVKAARETVGEPWEDLVPLGSLAKLPEFPIDTLPGYMADMARAIATEVQVPVDLPAALAMGVVATAAGGRAEVLVRGQWREPVNLFAAIAMPPGAGKSPAFRAMCEPVFAAERQLRDLAREENLRTATARETAIAQAQELRRKAKSEQDIEVAVKKASDAEAMAITPMPRLTADDVTPEQAGTIMSEQGGRLAVMSAEGTFFSVLMGRYTSGTPNLELVLKAHAGDRVQVDRRGRSELIERPALTIMTTVQPTVLRDVAAKPGMRERGILARFLMAFPRDLVGIRDVEAALAPADVLRAYKTTMEALVTGIAGRNGEPAVLALTPGALKLHTEFRRDLEPRLKAGSGDLEALRDWAAKLPGATARIAGLLHIAERLTDGLAAPVGDDTMQRAITQAEYWTEHAMAAFGAMRQHPALDDARAILDWIAAGDRKEFTERDVYRTMHRRFHTSASAATALSVLDEHGYVRRAEADGGARRAGRPVVRYEVHPKAVTR